MDKELLDKLHEVATEQGLDPSLLDKALDPEGIPEELREAMAAVLGDIGVFAAAINGLKEKEE